MRKAFAASAVLLLALTTVIQLVAVGTAEGATQNGNGVTSTSIKVGITYPDVAAIATIINVNPGNYKVAYTTLINQINSRGGINGRKIVPVFAPVDPLGTAGAATACTHLTEDESVFAVLGFFQAADVACYLNQHDTPIIGASLTAAQSAQAKAPWFNNIISDSELIPKEMAIFKQEGAFAGKKVGVVGTSPDEAEMNQVVPLLHKLKVNVVQTATNSVPDTDVAAFNQEYGVIAEKFKSAGVDTVVAVGNAGNSWAEALQMNQSTYHPRIVATDYIDLDAYVTNKLGYQDSIIKDGLTAGGYAPVAVVWNDPSMKRCIASIQAAEPGAPINDPVTATSQTPVTWTAPELACQQMALFSAFVKAAGKTLTNQTLAKGAKSIPRVVIPGGGGALSYPAGHGDGNGPVFVYQWSPSKKILQLKTTAG
ncbi:MAG TPA: ABC transporter substrate-binding protein [Acidimicrobiales bacterium]|nr:ABC transporter substrate-binding protein [Acidimicrobiales bacterium]